MEARAEHPAADGQHHEGHDRSRGDPRRRRWQNTNQLLGSYPGAFGIKTGHTRGAGYCLLFEAARHGRTLIGVVLNSSGTNPVAAFTAAARILNWAFAAR